METDANAGVTANFNRLPTGLGRYCASNRGRWLSLDRCRVTRSPTEARRLKIGDYRRRHWPRGPARRRPARILIALKRAFFDLLKVAR
ncbi:MAG: hypothetical protein R3E66_22100 [bacterium]